MIVTPQQSDSERMSFQPPWKTQFARIAENIITTVIAGIILTLVTSQGVWRILGIALTVLLIPVLRMWTISTKPYLQIILKIFVGLMTLLSGWFLWDLGIPRMINNLGTWRCVLTSTMILVLTAGTIAFEFIRIRRSGIVLVLPIALAATLTGWSLRDFTTCCISDQCEYCENVQIPQIIVDLTQIPDFEELRQTLDRYGRENKLAVRLADEMPKSRTGYLFMLKDNRIIGVYKILTNGLCDVQTGRLIPGLPQDPNVSLIYVELREDIYQTKQMGR